MKPLTERQIQIRFVSWFRQRYPEASGVFFSVPNGGARNAWTAKNLKDEGALSGPYPADTEAWICKPTDRDEEGGRQTERHAEAVPAQC